VICQKHVLMMDILNVLAYACGPLLLLKIVVFILRRWFLGGSNLEKWNSLYDYFVRYPKLGQKRFWFFAERILDVLNVLGILAVIILSYFYGYGKVNPAPGSPE
jgi:hypothetical protein